MTAWSSNAVYTGLTGLSAFLNGLATKLAWADRANGFCPKAPVCVRHYNHLLDEVKDEITAGPGAQVPATRTITAGNGLTGGGNLTADRSLAVLANGASIGVAAGGVSVGVIDDTMHGSRGAASLHAVATTSVAGFASAADITNLEALYAEYLAKQYSCITITDTGTQNNYSPTGWDAADIVICNNASALTLTGLAAPTAAGKWIKYFVAITTNSVGVTDEDAGSTAANRIRCMSGHRTTAAQYSAFTASYARAASSPRWRAVGELSLTT